ncbi:MAG: Ribonucleoside-diphosphate reductase, partial [Synergistales bacterium 57_84]
MDGSGNLPNRDLPLSDNAMRVLEERYLFKDGDSKIIETPDEMFWRVARFVATAEEDPSDDTIVKMFHDIMARLDFLPNSPTLMNAGRQGGQLAACFVLPVEDSMEGIFDSLKHMALIHKSGGGTGYNFSKLRPKGDKVSSTNGIASGPISFMGMFDHATEVVMQGGVKARELFRLICEMAWKTGDPGMVFLDKMNKDNALAHLGAITSTNPCVSGDSLIHTVEGPKPARDLCGRRVDLLLNGKRVSSSEAGFFKTGEKPVFRLETREGFSIRLTEDHPILKVSRKTRYREETEWVAAGKLKPGDRIKINDHRSWTDWEGFGTLEEGYIMGLLLGDGTIKKDKTVLSLWVPDTKAAG